MNSSDTVLTGEQRRLFTYNLHLCHALLVGKSAGAIKQCKKKGQQSHNLLRFFKLEPNAGPADCDPFILTAVTTHTEGVEVCYWSQIERQPHFHVKDIHLNVYQIFPYLTGLFEKTIPAHAPHTLLPTEQAIMTLS